MNPGTANDRLSTSPQSIADLRDARGRLHILCVEDEPEILADIVDELNHAGFAAEGAANGEEALRKIEARAPDLVISDIQMPGLDGISLLRELRGRERAGSTVPFIFLTAFSDSRHLIEGRQAGADDYIVKPIDYDLLIAAIESRLAICARREEQTRMEVSGITTAEQERARSRIAGLTQREREVLTKLSQGKANKVIAYELNLSIRTVELYRASLMRALGVRSLAEALKIAVAGGLANLNATGLATS